MDLDIPFDNVGSVPHSLDLDTVPHLEAYSRPDTNIDIEAKMFEMFFRIVMCSHPSVNLAGLL